MPCKLTEDECSMYCKHKGDKQSCPNFLPETDDQHIEILEPKSEGLQIDDNPVESNTGAGFEEGANISTQDYLDMLSENDGGKQENNATGSQPDKEYKVGPGRPPLETRFTKDKQPSRQAKALGWQKIKFARQTIKSMLEMPAEIPEDLKEGLSKIYGEEALKHVTVGQLMTLRQMFESINSGNVNSYNAIMGYSIGKPVQGLAFTDEDGNAVKGVQLAFPVGMKLNFPSNAEGEEIKPIS